jgi:UDP-3-O-[3-hydroxymyristoyl] N-acetylglucosamine deacetylase
VGSPLQNTLKSAISFTGVGLHSGTPVRMVVKPASANHGIWFKRVDIEMGDRLIPARYDAAIQSPLCTKLQNPSGAVVSTVEHLLAALMGCGVHNALIEINGPEVPILDGSSVKFVQGIMNRGIVAQNQPVHAIKVTEPITVSEGGAHASLVPYSVMRLEFHIDFPDPAIGQQSKSLTLSNGSFARELSDSRTFCQQSDVQAMQANGLALGGCPGENAVVFDQGVVISPGGLRHGDEPVRHKMLDALGDLALAGGPVLGKYTGVRAGHSLTNKLLRKAFATPGALKMVCCVPSQAALLPGHGLHWREIPQVA